MKQFEVNIGFRYRWWRVDDKDIVPEHISALEKTAMEHIGKMLSEGYVEGELIDNIHMIDSDPEEGIDYRGYWRRK